MKYFLFIYYDRKIYENLGYLIMFEYFVLVQIKRKNVCYFVHKIIKKLCLHTKLVLS